MKSSISHSASGAGAREPLVLDAIHEQPMQFVLEDRRHRVQEPLRVVEELGQPAGLLEDADERRAGQFGLVLQVGQHVGDGRLP